MQIFDKEKDNFIFLKLQIKLIHDVTAVNIVSKNIIIYDMCY